MTRSLTGSYPDTRREHHPAAPRVCELPPRQRPLRLPRPSPPRPRTRSLAQLFRRPNCRVSGESEEEVELDHPNEGSLPTTGQRRASEYTEPNPASWIALQYAIFDE